MGHHIDARKVEKGIDIRGDDAAAERARSGGDDQIVSASWATSSADVNEQDRVRRCNVEVIVEDRDAGHDVVDIRSARRPSPASCEKGAHPQLGDRDGRDGDVVIVSDERLDV